MKKKIFIICLFIFLILINVRVSNANSYLTYHRGAQEYGLIPYYDSSLDVIKEDLTFNIVDFPEPWSENSEYKSTVTAEYTIKNSSSETENIRLLFPYGEDPYYSYNTLDEKQLKYNVEINGKKVNMNHRFTTNNYDDSYIDELAKIKDAKNTDAFYNKDLSIYIYKLTVENTFDEGFLTIDFTKKENYKIMCDSWFNIREEKNNSIKVSQWIGKNDSYYFYIMGSSDDSFKDTIKVYEDYDMRRTINCKINVSFIETINYDDFVNKQFNDLFIDENKDQYAYIDYYNVVLENIKSNNSCLINSVSSVFNSLSNTLNWIDYDISVKPGETIVNSVTSTIYPDIDISYEPYYYTYKYVLSPASTWHSFSNLTVYVNTSLYMSDETLRFEKTNTGFKAFYENLPNTELEFRLCESESPEYHPYKSHYGSGFWLAVVIIAGFALILSSGIIACIPFIIINAVKKRFVNFFRMFEIVIMDMIVIHAVFGINDCFILTLFGLSVIMLIIEKFIFKTKIFARSLLVSLAICFMILGIYNNYFQNNITVYSLMAYSAISAVILIVNNVKYKKQIKKENKTAK